MKVFPSLPARDLLHRDSVLSWEARVGGIGRLYLSFDLEPFGLLISQRPKSLHSGVPPLLSSYEHG